MGRYTASRQKSCQQCSSAKARCDRRRGGCTRCAQRGQKCSFNLPLTPQSSANTAVEDFDDISSEVIPTKPGSTSANIASPVIKNSYTIVDSLNFEQLDLICPINADEISNRWLNPYLPIPGQKAKDYPRNVTSFIYRILKSYAAIAIRGRMVRSLVHPAQLALPSASLPLSACLRLVRIWDNPPLGSDYFADGILQQEMDKLYEQHRIYDDINLLAAFQAYLIFTMVLFFHSNQRSPLLRQAMTNLQDIACESSRRGLVCEAEQHQERPKWEAWIAAEAKRRTLYTMYMFDNVLSAHEGLPSYLGVELQGLPAPGSQALWNALNRNEWEKAYTIHLAEWLDGYLCIDELWPSPPNMDESSLAQRRKRVDHWLEGIDEFGTMLYAVTSQTHGS